MNKIKLTVLCITYNHVRFIRQALDGFVMQKTNFPFEVLIHDDASTDGTADIIREYAKKYPDIIKPVLQTENQMSKGVYISQIYQYPNIRGKYVAVCDGDDYWCDENKLQRQVDFLDAHPDYTICFHPCSVFYDDDRPDSVWPNVRKLHDVTLEHLMKDNFIPNCSVMYRWQPKDLNIIKEWPKNIYPGDWFVHLLHARYGKIGFLPDVMSRYRRHSGGVSFVSERGVDALHMKYGIKELNFFLAVEKQIAPDPKKYHTFVCTKAREIFDTYTQYKDFDSARIVLNLCPDLMMPCKNKPKFIYQLLLVIIVIILLIFIIILGIKS